MNIPGAFAAPVEAAGFSPTKSRNGISRALAPARTTRPKCLALRLYSHLGGPYGAGASFANYPRVPLRSTLGYYRFSLREKKM